MGSVATFRQQHNERHDVGVTSDCILEQLCDEIELADSLTDATYLICPFRIAHRFVTLDRAVDRV